jgi:hypothetical protein
MPQECMTLEDKVCNRTPVRYRGFYLSGPCKALDSASYFHLHVCESCEFKSFQMRVVSIEKKEAYVMDWIFYIKVSF